MTKKNPFEFVFEDIAKFDTQNTIIGNLLSQIESGRLTDKTIQKILAEPTNVKDIDYEERLRKLREPINKNNEDNDDDEDDNNNNNNNDIFGPSLPP